MACADRGSLPATCLGMGPPSHTIESCPDTKVWQMKHLGYVIMMKGHCSKLLARWDTSRRWYKAHGTIVLPFLPLSLGNSFFPLLLTVSPLYCVAASRLHQESLLARKESSQIVTAGRKTQFLKV